MEVKAVYAPVYPDVESVSLPKNAKSVNIPIRNDYDFISIDDVDIAWQLFVDDKELDKGTGHVKAQPHTTASLSVSTSRLGTVAEGQTCYVRLSFTRNGEELAQKHVVLKPARIQRAQSAALPLSFEENERAVIVKAGESTFEFSRQTGLFANIKRDGKTAVQGLRPSIWHSLNEGDQIIKNRVFESGKDPERAVPTVRVMETRQTSAGIVVTADVDYVIDSLNRFSASYVSTIAADGSLSVDYTIRPEVQMTYLPVVGMAVHLTSATDLKQWLGLGPYDAYPNKKAACTLGVWPAQELTGTRQAQWVELETSGGVKTRILADGYIDRDKTTSKEIRIVSQVLGRAEKGRLNDRNYQVLPNKTYRGRIYVSGAGT